MDFSLGEDRQLLVDSLSRYMADKFGFEAREAAIASSEGWSRELWTGLAELGAIGALFSEDAGGYGGSPFDIGAVFGELGHGLAVGPFLGTLLAGRVLAAAGEGDALESVIAGEAILTFAHEPAQSVDGRPVAPTTARNEGGQWTLSGAKGVVEYAGDADMFLVSAIDSAGETSAFLVDRKAAGVEVRAYHLVDGGAAGEVAFMDTPARLVGQASGAGPVIADAIAAGLVALSWEGVAIMDVLRDQTLEYLRTRRQFGIPIGKFQALQHRMATVALEIDQARSSAINAAAGYEAGGVERDMKGAAAKYTIGATGSLVAEEAIQMHGGIGMSWELPLSHYAKRLIMIGHLLGDEDYHLERFIALSRQAEAA